MSDSVVRPTPGERRGTASRMDRGLTLGTAVAVGVALVPESRWLTVAGMVALLVITVLACRRPSPAVLRAVLMSDLIVLLFSLYLFAGWPPALVTTLFVVAPVAAGVVLHRLGRLRPVAPWLRWGRLSPPMIALFLATVVASVAGLAVWALVYKPDVSDYLGQLRDTTPWQAFLAVAGFSVVNSAWEEMLFRGVLLTELLNTWGPRAALVIESVSFGVSHANGFPSGVVGVLMALAWGFVLGVIRMRTGGIGFPFAAHVVSNATIALLAYSYL
ncbi:type II CAAX endopeptidase family protein [Sphaerisporangium sp. B11E5]|uniref:CPBP family intramembrane glutamic endopeptidase n=1 Tax=Sphaerisporangium sp. B11E5 TaxID=3153563 RepID=UPI00325EAC73